MISEPLDSQRVLKMTCITSIISILSFGVAPGHFKYLFANPEAWRPFDGAHDGSAPPPWWN